MVCWRRVCCAAAVVRLRKDQLGIERALQRLPVSEGLGCALLLCGARRSRLACDSWGSTFNITHKSPSPFTTSTRTPRRERQAADSDLLILHCPHRVKEVPEVVHRQCRTRPWTIPEQPHHYLGCQGLFRYPDDLFESFLCLTTVIHIDWLLRLE